MPKRDVRDMERRRAALVDQMEALVDKAADETRSLTETEETSYTELRGQVASLDKDLAREDELRDLRKKEDRQSDPGHRGDPAIGMTDKELQNYSLVRAINAAITGDWRKAGLELEASQAVAKRLGREPQGFFVPYDWQQRDLTKGTAGAGGYTVSTDLLATSFIDLLRNKQVLSQAGATILSGLVGDVKIPRQTGGATAYWVDESGAPTESQQTVDQVSLTPKTLGVFTDISRKLLLQSSIDVEGMVRTDLATVIALAIDLAGLHGTGADNQPTGIAATTGIGSVAGGANGLAPTWAHIVGLETEVATDNADIGRLGYVTNAKVRGKLKVTDMGTDTGRMVWADNKTPVNGYSAHVSNQVSSALTKGDSTGVCSAIFFGNWADLIIGMWGVLDILVDPYTGGTSGTVRVIALQDVDVAVRHAQSFAAMLDALTS